MAGRSSSCRCRRSLGVKEGLNLPRYPSVPGRLRARKKEIADDRAGAAARAAPTKIGLRLPEGTESQVEVIGRGADAAPAVVELLVRKLGVAGPMTVLVLVEHADGAPGPAVARGAGARRGARRGDRRAARRGRWSAAGARGAAAVARAHGVGAAHVVDDPRLADVRAGGLGGGARAARRRAVRCDRPRRRQRARQRGPGPRRGPKLDLPMAANVTEVAPRRAVARSPASAGPGSLLEDCALDAPTELLTVAPHAVAVEEAAAGAAPAVATFAPQLTDADLAVARRRAASSRIAPASRSPTREVVVGGGRGVGSAEGFAELEELAGLLGGGGRRVAGRDERRLAAALRSDRPDGAADRAGPLHRLRDQRRDPAHRRAARRRSGSSRSTPTPRRRSWPSPTTR